MKFNQGYLRRTSALVFFLALTFIATSCGLVPGKDPGASVSQAGTTPGGGGGTLSPLQTFQNGFYAFATSSSSSCVQCHGSGAEEASNYGFAVTNVTSACQNALSLANLQNPASSMIAVNAGNGHCGQAACAASSGAVTTFIQTWAASVAALGPSGTGCSTATPVGSTPSPTPTTGGGATANCAPGLVAPLGLAYMTQPVAIPTTLPVANATGAILNFPLSNVSPALAAVSGGVFQVQAEQLSATTIQITAPRMANSTATTVTGIHILLQRQGTTDTPCEFPSGESWTGVSVPVPASTVTNPPSTTTPLTATIIGTGNAPMPNQFNGTTYALEVSIGFDAIGAPANPNAKFSYIQANVLTPTCLGCHGGAGGFTFDTYADAVKAVSLFNPTASPLYYEIAPGGLMPLNGTPLSATFQQAIHDWIVDGAPNN